MKRSTLITVLLLAATLGGCAGHPETRPFSNEENYQLSLEALARQGLPFDEYVRQRAVLVRAHDSNAGQVAQAPAGIAVGRDS